MSLKFTFNDFKGGDIELFWEDAALLAQKKFDEWVKENGKVIYGSISNEVEENWAAYIGVDKDSTDEFEALLINIKNLYPCKHPKEKISFNAHTKRLIEEGTPHKPMHYRCECGAKVVPEEFKEIK